MAGSGADMAVSRSGGLIRVTLVPLLQPSTGAVGTHQDWEVGRAVPQTVGLYVAAVLCGARHAIQETALSSAEAVRAWLGQLRIPVPTDLLAPGMLNTYRLPRWCTTHVHSARRTLRAVVYGMDTRVWEGWVRRASGSMLAGLLVECARHGMDMPRGVVGPSLCRPMIATAGHTEAQARLLTLLRTGAAQLVHTIPDTKTPCLPLQFDSMPPSEA